MVGFVQNNPHHCYDVWEHTLHAMEAVEGDVILRCTMLLHDVGKPRCFSKDAKGDGHFYGHPAVSAAMAEEMLRRLRCDNRTRETITLLVEWHDRNIPRTEPGIRRALMALGEENLRHLLAVKRADNLAQAPAFRGTQQQIQLAEEILERLLAENACFSLKQLAVNGRDLMALGYAGVEVGLGLSTLLEQVIDGALPNTREALVEYLQNGADLTHPEPPGEKKRNPS